MKKSPLQLLSLFGLLFFMSACGTDTDKPPQKLIPIPSTIVEIERGPVKRASLSDAQGVFASDYNNSNFYIFENYLPTYPLAVSHGFIEINNERNKTVVLDTNMSSYTNVITPITTILSDTNESKREALEIKLMQEYSLTREELYLSASKSKNENIAILTNAIFKKAKEYNKSISAIFNYETLIVDANTTLRNEFDALAAISEPSILTDGKVDSIKLESYLYDTNVSIFTQLSDLIKLPYKEISSAANINDIWNLSFLINPSLSYKDVEIGVRIVKYEDDGSNDIGEFLYSGVNIENNTISNPTRIDVYGVGDSGSGRKWFDAQHNIGSILENAITLEDGIITLNLGYIIQNQDLVDESSFRAVTKYDIVIVSSLPIFKYSTNTTIKLINNRHSFEDEQGMIGEIRIK